MDKPAYVRVVTTGRVVAWSPFMEQELADGLVVPYTGPLPVPSSKAKPVAVKDTAPEVPDEIKLEPAKNSNDRKMAVIDAVLAIPKEKWTPARFGRPAMPMLADVEAITGLKDVGAEEIITALEFTKE